MGDFPHPFANLGSGSEPTFTEMIQTQVGGFGTVVVTFSQVVQSFILPDPNIQIQRGTPVWWDCQAAIPNTSDTIQLSFLGGLTDATAIRIIGTPVVVVPLVDPIGFPQEELVPFP